MAAVKIAKDGKTVVECRASIGAPLGGMRPDIDAAALDKTDFVQLRNIRRIGPSIIDRPGQLLFYQFEIGAHNEPTGIGDLPIGAKRRLMLVGDGCPGIDPGAGFSLSSYCMEQIASGGLGGGARFQPMIYRPDAALSFSAARFLRAASVTGLLPAIDAVFFGADTILYRLTNIPFNYGVTPLSFTNGGQQNPVWTIPSAYASIGPMIQHGSELIIAVNGGIGASAIFSYNGLTFTRELDGIDPITGFGLFRDMLVAGHTNTTNLMRIRTAAGVWSTLAPGSGVFNIPGNYRCASYSDKLYIPPFDDRLYVWDGAASLTEIPAATTGVDVGATIHSVESAFDKLYYTWFTADPKAYIGRYDRTTWDPVHKDLLGQFPELNDVRGIRNFQGCLMVVGVKVAAAINGAFLYKSPRRDTAGTYEEIEPSNVSNTDDINELFLY